MKRYARSFAKISNLYEKDTDENLQLYIAF
jgi:hypothetical protein